MSGNLVDAYIKALAALEELPFQRAIVQRLLVALNNFQTVPSNPQGDGGLDGHSDHATRAYCCYGLQYAATKSAKQRSKKLAAKFSKDLRRLYEVGTKANGKVLRHEDNDALLRHFGKLPDPANRICHVTLIANWFESHEAYGEIIQNRARYALASQCRWITPTADVVLKGPREFVDQYGTDQSSMLWLEHQGTWDQLEKDAVITELPDGPTFDSKMTAAEDWRPDSRSEVVQIADLLRADWQRAIAFEKQLDDRLPQLRKALERGRKNLKLQVLTQDKSDPWETLRRSQQIAESIFRDDFRPIYGEAMVRELASGETARLVGECPINWKAKTRVSDV